MALRAMDDFVYRATRSFTLIDCKFKAFANYLIRKWYQCDINEYISILQLISKGSGMYVFFLFEATSVIYGVILYILYYSWCILFLTV